MTAALLFVCGVFGTLSRLPVVGGVFAPMTVHAATNTIILTEDSNGDVYVQEMLGSSQWSTISSSDSLDLANYCNDGESVTIIVGNNITLSSITGFPSNVNVELKTNNGSSLTLSNGIDGLDAGSKLMVFPGFTLNVMGGKRTAINGELVNNGTLHVNTGHPTFEIGATGSLTNNGVMTSTRDMINTGTITNNGTFSTMGDMDNNGIINNSGSGTITNSGSMISDGTINNSGTFTNNTSGTVINSGMLNNNNTIINSGMLINNSTINNQSGNIYDVGTMSGSGTISGNTPIQGLPSTPPPSTPSVSTVEIATSRWYSFHRSVMEALAARPDVTLVISFLSEGYKGDRLILTIPAGTDTIGLLNEDGYAGFFYISWKLGTLRPAN